MPKGLKICNRASGLISGVTLFLIMLLVVVDVTLRWLVNFPIPGSIEFVKVLMVVIVFLGLSYTEENGGNIKLEALICLFPYNFKRWFDIFRWLAGFFLFALITWKGFETAMHSFRIQEYYPGEIRIPIYPARIVIVLGSILICLQYLTQIVTKILRSESQNDTKITYQNKDGD